MALASVVIAILALLFTVGSFWWIQARRGRLRSFPPQAFSGYLAVDGAALRLPLAIFNDGAAPIVVTDLRLLLRVAGGAEVPMHGNTFRKSLRPETDDVDDFAHPFAVPGRTVVARHVEFRSRVGPRALLSGHMADAAIEGLLDGEKGWTELVAFPLHVEAMAHVGQYVTYSNDPAVWPTGLVDHAAASFSALRAQLDSQG